MTYEELLAQNSGLNTYGPEFWSAVGTPQVGGGDTTDYYTLYEGEQQFLQNFGLTPQQAQEQGLRLVTGDYGNDQFISALVDPNGQVIGQKVTAKSDPMGMFAQFALGTVAMVGGIAALGLPLTGTAAGSAALGGTAATTGGTAGTVAAGTGAAGTTAGTIAGGTASAGGAGMLSGLGSFVNSPLVAGLAPIVAGQLLQPDAPEFPDPMESAGQQAELDRQAFDYQLQQGRVNSNTPYGSQTWVQEVGPDGIPRWTLNTSFSPEMQQLFDANTQSQLQQAGLLQGAGDRVSDALSQPINWGSIPGVITSMDPMYGTGGFDLRNLSSQYADAMTSLNPAEYNQIVADALYRQNARYLDPQQNQALSSLEARLAEQGFVPGGTPGYDREIDNFRSASERAYADARDRSITLGSQVGSQQFGNRLSALGQGFGTELSGVNAQMQQEQQNFQRGLASSTFANQASGDAMNRMLLQRNQPLAELNAIRGGTQPQMPQATPQYSTPGMQAPNLMGLQDNQYQSQLAGYNANVASNNQLINAGMGFAGSYLNRGMGGTAPSSSAPSGQNFTNSMTTPYAPQGGYDPFAMSNWYTNPFLG
jgi:hypothetical protein